MLFLDDLRRSVDDGRIDTVLLTFTDLYGRPLGKRLDAGFFLENAQQGTHVCDYLLTVDMNMDPVPGYRLASWGRGYGGFRIVSRPGHPARRKLARKDRAGVVRPDPARLAWAARPGAALNSAPAGGTGRRHGVPGHGRLGTGVLQFQPILPAGGRGRVCLPRACRMVPGGLPRPAGYARGSPERGRAAPPHPVGHPGGMFQG